MNRYPSTLLGNPKKRKKYWSEFEQAFIFDRRKDYVLPILEFYISGNNLQRHEFLDLECFLDEIEYFEMESVLIEKKVEIKKR